MRPCCSAAAPRSGRGIVACLLVMLLVGCAPSRQFKDQSADVLDVARQLHWSGCEEEALLQQDLCDKAYFVLTSSEPGLEDEIAKRRALKQLWDTVSPVVVPYLKDRALTAAQLLLAYLSGTLIGGALTQ